MIELKITFPFDANLSENKRLAYNPRGRRFFRNSRYAKTQKFLEEIIGIKAHNEGVKFQDLPIFVYLDVYAPNHHSDPGNFVKAVNDAVSRAIGVNDNKFSGYYHGYIDRENPRFEIAINQRE